MQWLTDGTVTRGLRCLYALTAERHDIAVIGEVLMRPRIAVGDPGFVPPPAGPDEAPANRWVRRSRRVVETRERVARCAHCFVALYAGEAERFAAVPRLRLSGIQRFLYSELEVAQPGRVKERKEV